MTPAKLCANTSWLRRYPSGSNSGVPFTWPVPQRPPTSQPRRKLASKVPATKPGRGQEHVTAETDADGPPVQVADDDRLAAERNDVASARVVVSEGQVAIDGPGGITGRVEELRPAADLHGAAGVQVPGESRVPNRKGGANSHVDFLPHRPVRPDRPAAIVVRWEGRSTHRRRAGDGRRGSAMVSRYRSRDDRLAGGGPRRRQRRLGVQGTSRPRPADSWSRPPSHPAAPRRSAAASGAPAARTGAVRRPPRRRRRALRSSPSVVFRA